MSLAEVVLEGTLRADGSLVLDEKPDLPPGRVTVVLRHEQEATTGSADAFLERMKAIWAMQRSGSGPHDGGESTLAEVKRQREEWEEHQHSLEETQRQCSEGSVNPPEELQ